MTTSEQSTILVVEDEQALQEALKLKLEKAGVRILTASTGEDALETLKNETPTLVSLDILLPNKNGLEVLQILRSNPNTTSLPVVIVSVSWSIEKVKRAFSLNVVDYLVKSEYTIDEIVEKLKDLADNIRQKHAK